MAPTTPPLEPRTWRGLLERLKQDGPQDASALAGELGVSAMAVRQHLYALEKEGLVGFEAQARPVGRPAKLWRLTAAADRFFPDGHADLTLNLLAAMREAFGEEGLEKLLAVRTADQIAAYRRRVDRAGPLKARLQALARIRSEEGYMAAVETVEEGGGFLLVENHCPVCAAARTCQGLCASELEVFRRVLGPDVSVERGDHILAGARRCAYRVRPAG
jgi:predicted ArsR family transcriptional regulator